MVSGEVCDGLSSGAISYDTEYIGYNGTGTFDQDGGTNTISSTFELGHSTGTLSAGNEYIGGGLLLG